MDNRSSFSFTKMQGAGNDFILFDNRSVRLSDDELAILAPSICDRKFGVGADGIIALQFDESKKADLVMLYKNPDGSNAGMCGNGARCFALYAVTLGSPREFSFRVHDHIYQASVQDDAATVSFPLTTRVYEQTAAGEHLLTIYTNTEHVVCVVTEQALCNETDLTAKGRFIRYHEAFYPAGTNVNFMAGIDQTHLCLQTYERGVENLTLACGTGAVSSAIGWHHLQQEASGDFTYEVNVKGGTLTVTFSFHKETKEYSNIKLSGPAAFVFEGEYYL